MEEKKSVKISLSTFFLLLSILVIIAMAYYIYTEKVNSNKIIADLEANTVNMQDKIDNLQGKLDSISNTINSNTTSNTENTTNKSENVINNDNKTSTNNKDKNIKYVFTSADQAAMQGFPKTLKIFELNDFEMKFSYNSAFDFSTSTIDRTVTGTAKVNAEQIYEFEEMIDSHQYQLMFEFDKNKETVKVIDLDNGNKLGWINLYR